MKQIIDKEFILTDYKSHMMLNVQEKKDYNKDANPAPAIRHFFPKYKLTIKTPKKKGIP